MKPSQSLKRSLSRTPDDSMDYDSDDKDSRRKSRNLSEKKRRDQFNLLVNELSSMISTTGRKMDKSTVLKSTISFLKSHNEFTNKSRVNEIQEEWKPTFLTNEEFIHLILEAVDGFIIVFSTSGHIYYASESITSLLGHMPSDVAEMSLYDMTIADDKENLYNILSNPSDLETPLSFSCHIKRGALKSLDPVSYELIRFIGYFRPDDDMLHDSQGHTEEDETRYVFVGTGRTQTPLLIKEIPLVDLHRTEFTSRHSLEWKFLFLDHRAPPIIGYLPFELLGTSGYEYYHVDDLENVINCHKALMQKGEGTSCHYRFLTKGQQWIWLQTRFFITYHQWNSKPEFVVCTHQVVSYTEVVEQARKDWSQSSPTNKPVLGGAGENLDIKPKRRRGESDCTSMTADSPGSFGPQQSTASNSNNIDNAEQTQFQAELQKKQSELQIIIDQQQQELRRVSEQLLMAKLGLVQQQQQQQQREKSPKPSHQVSSCQASSSSMVSSTTTARTGSVIVPATQPQSQVQQQHQQFYQPDSNSKNI